MKLANNYFLSTTLMILSASSPTSMVDSHAWMPFPVSRNQYAVTHGVWSPAAGKPKKETTPQGVNSNTNVCGSQGSNNYDAWLDSEGNPMPWISQAHYAESEDVRVDVAVTAHHYGHFTVSACPNGRESTQDCFDDHPLEFVADLSADGRRMPKDGDHPERAMLWGDATEASYLFKLPDGLKGDEVLLQWIYWTANSCNYEGYREYFEAHQEAMPSADKGNWNPQLEGCGPIENIPMIRQGTVIAEIFVNCAEVSVGEGSGGGGDDQSSPTKKPTDSPKQTSPPTSSPTNTDVEDNNSPTCKDTDEKFAVGKKNRTCKWAGKGTKNCNKKLKNQANGKKKVKDLCPVTCGECPSSELPSSPTSSPVVAPTPPPVTGTDSGCTPGCNCVAIPQQQLPQGSWQTVDGNCAACANGQAHWPCNLATPICRCSNLRRKQ